MNFLRNLLTKVTYLGLDNIQPGLVLNLFLILPKNPGWRSYKLGSYKKKRVVFAQYKEEFFKFVY